MHGVALRKFVLSSLQPRIVLSNVHPHPVSPRIPRIPPISRIPRMPRTSTTPYSPRRMSRTGGSEAMMFKIFISFGYAQQISSMWGRKLRINAFAKIVDDFRALKPKLSRMIKFPYDSFATNFDDFRTADF